MTREGVRLLCLLGATGLLIIVAGVVVLNLSKPVIVVDTSPAPSMGTWSLPSCPRELTLQNGERWAKPQWSDPTCEAAMIWTVEP